MKRYYLHIALFLILIEPIAAQEDVVSCSDPENKAIYAVFEPDRVTSFEYIVTPELRHNTKDHIWRQLINNRRGYTRLHGFSTLSEGWRRWEDIDQDSISKRLMNMTRLVFDTLPSGMYWYGIRTIDTVTLTYNIRHDGFYNLVDSSDKKIACFQRQEMKMSWCEDHHVPVYQVDRLDVSFHDGSKGYQKASWKKLHDYLVVIGVTQPLDTGRSFYPEFLPGAYSPRYLDELHPGYDVSFEAAVPPGSEFSTYLTVTGAVAEGNSYSCESGPCLEDYKIWYEIRKGYGEEHIPRTCLTAPSTPFDYYHGSRTRRKKTLSELLWWGDLDRDGIPDLILRHNYHNLEQGADQDRGYVQHVGYQLILSSEIEKYARTESIIRSVNPVY